MNNMEVEVIKLASAFRAGMQYWYDQEAYQKKVRRGITPAAAIVQIAGEHVNHHTPPGSAVNEFISTVNNILGGEPPRIVERFRVDAGRLIISLLDGREDVYVLKR